MKNILLRLRKKSNSGSTLVTAVIVVAFMSIMGTIALYIAGENYKMKVIDEKNKQSFYEAEILVETLKSQLVIDVASAAQSSTKAAGASYVEWDSVGYREEQYLKTFNNQLNSIWKSHFNDGDGNVDKTKAMTQLFGANGKYTVSNVTATDDTWSFDIVIDSKKYKCEINEVSSGFSYREALKSPTTLITKNPETNINEASPYYIEDFNITVTDSKGFVSVIKTSFKITPPVLNWDSSQPKLMNDGTNKVISESDYTNCVLYYNWSKE